jgi:hypothetical protein
MLCTQLPDVQQPLDDVRNAIDNINFDSLVDEGRQTFDSIRQEINNGVSSNLDGEEFSALIPGV